MLISEYKFVIVVYTVLKQSLSDFVQLRIVLINLHTIELLTALLGLLNTFKSKVLKH